MSQPTIKSAADRSGAFAQLAVVPIVAFLLGRQSITFNGSASAWFLLACNGIALAICLYHAGDAIRKAP